MRVWINQRQCTSSSLCEVISPAVFTLVEDGLAYVKQGDTILRVPGGAGSVAIVPAGLEDEVTQAAEQCPGECIFIEED